MLHFPRAAVTLAQTLQRHSADAGDSLNVFEPHGSSDNDILDPDVVVAATAALDGCFYALLEHSLTCGWAAPGVPPPHLWFPAMAAAHTGWGKLTLRNQDLSQTLTGLDS
jgi:hypothetical protein